jgi:hypothetical protein
MKWISKVVQEIRETKVPAPDGTWVTTRKEYKAAQRRAGGGK